MRTETKMRIQQALVTSSCNKRYVHLFRVGGNFQDDKYHIKIFSIPLCNIIYVQTKLIYKHRASELEIYQKRSEIKL